MVNQRAVLSGAQLRAARALLNVSAEMLAEEASVGLRTIGRAEKENGPVRMTQANSRALMAALEARGVIFIPEDAGGPGVALRKYPPPDFG